MSSLSAALSIASFAAVVLEAFLLWGALQMIGRLNWRMDQLELTTPSKLGRNGLRPGRKAPEFTLPDVNGREVSLRDFAGRRVLLVFMQPGCGPCNDVVPELNRLIPERDGVEVVIINRGDPEQNREWARSRGVRFPVLSQTGIELSRRYEAYATPFGFVIDERGVIRSRGVVNSKQATGYVLEEASRNHDTGPDHAGPAQQAPSASAELSPQLS
jgi:methylamine dehydrogenase accessory protein MauD